MKSLINMTLCIIFSVNLLALGKKCAFFLGASHLKNRNKNPISVSAKFMNRDVLSPLIVNALLSLRKMVLDFTEMYKKMDKLMKYG